MNNGYRMRIGVIGVNHKQAPLALRETIAKACSRRFGLDNPLAISPLVLLSTCNRSELYFSSESLATTHEEILAILKAEIADDFEQKLYTFFGLECFIHLAKVTAGLDSAIIAETEIQGQVRTAYELAKNGRTLPQDLHFLFQKCLKIAKEVRSLYQIPTQVPDLEHALYWYAKDYFGDNWPKALFVGTSEINLKIARYFKKRGINDMAFCSRTDEKAKAAANELDTHILPWQELAGSWTDFDWIICATKSPQHILKGPSKPANHKKLLVDLAVPRNIDPSLETDNTMLLNIDDLLLLLEERRALLQQKIIRAEQMLQQSVLRQLALYRTKITPLPLAISV